MLTTLKVSEVKQSETNTKNRTIGIAFDELVASIKEKGVLQPILARKLKGKDKIGSWEVIAGNRRLAAAKEAGLEEIPAQVVEMTDDEAREAQIIENLQRADVHPIDEGETYRDLIETKRYELETISAKVGKTVDYIRSRLVLTNLEEKIKSGYRDGKINHGQALLIARIAKKSQDEAYKMALENVTTKDVKEWIERRIHSSLENQPWLKSPAAAKAVGNCVECSPNTATLFGDVKEGECTDLRCWERKMEKYIAWRVKEMKLVQVSSEYYYHGTSKSIVDKNNYERVGSKEVCDHAEKAIIAHGDGIGKEFMICRTKSCKTHGSHHSSYALTPAEKAKRKEERKKEKAKEDALVLARETRLKKALAKVKWPMTTKHMEAMLTIILSDTGATLFRQVAKRHKLEVKKTKATYGYEYYDYGKAVREMAEKLDNRGKIRLIFELIIDNEYGDLREGINKI